jgi:hypothetical protein
MGVRAGVCYRMGRHEISTAEPRLSELVTVVAGIIENSDNCIKFLSTHKKTTIITL